MLGSLVPAGSVDPGAARGSGRAQQYVNRELPDVQAGFRKGRGNRNQISNIHWTKRVPETHLLLLILNMPKPLCPLSKPLLVCPHRAPFPAFLSCSRFSPTSPLMGTGFSPHWPVSLSPPDSLSPGRSLSDPFSPLHFHMKQQEKKERSEGIAVSETDGKTSLQP